MKNLKNKIFESNISINLKLVSENTWEKSEKFIKKNLNSKEKIKSIININSEIE